MLFLISLVRIPNRGFPTNPAATPAGGIATKSLLVPNRGRSQHEKTLIQKLTHPISYAEFNHFTISARLFKIP